MRRRVTVLTCPKPSSTIRPHIQPHTTHTNDTDPLHGQALDLVAKGADLGVEVRGLVRGQGDGDDGARDTAGTAEGDLAGNVLQTR